MADLFNNFPSWGETGQYPSDGFFYDGGDQVNEKHMDSLWNGLDVHIGNINTAIRDRVRDLHGNVVLDQGLAASTGTGTREVDVTASSAGAYVNGQRTGSTSATTLTHTANGGASTRTDVVWVDTTGTVGKTEGTTSTTADRLKIAEVDVATDDTISDVRNYANDFADHFASERESGGSAGDFWHDLLNNRTKTYQGGSWRTLVTDQDTLTVTAGDGLKNGGSGTLDGGLSITLDIEPSDFAGDGLRDDGSDNLAVDVSAFAGSGLQDDGSENLQLSENSVTVAGNTVSLGGSTGVALGDLSNVTASGEGSGNGFDADTVDGNHASEIGKSDQEIRQEIILYSFGGGKGGRG